VSCIIEFSHKLKSIRENNKCLTVENPNETEYELGKVDGCLIVDSRVRCDFFIRTSDRMWFVELKGAHTRTAIDQIVQTTHHLVNEIGTRECNCVIVTSQCPAIAVKQKELLALKKSSRPISNVILKTRHASIRI
jgi:hypothetical protein